MQAPTSVALGERLLDNVGVKRALLNIAGFLAVFATPYGAVCLVTSLLALASGSADESGLKWGLVGAALLTVSFAIFRAHDRARTGSNAGD